MKRLLVSAVAAASLHVAAVAPVASAQAPLMQPTRQHEEMARDAGVWDGAVTLWMTEGGEPLTRQGVETNEMLGKMWLMSAFEGEFGGEKFSGRSAVGYDPLKKKYVGGWVDSMSPFMTAMAGDYDAATHTLTMMGEGIDAMTGKMARMKLVTRYESADAKNFQILRPIDGEQDKWWKTMEIKYARRK